MLKDPPCIRLLVGCSETDGGASSNDSDTGSTGLTLGGSSRASASSSSRSSTYDYDASPSSSLRDLSTRLPSFASGTLINRSAKEYMAHYTLTVRNLGSRALQGIKISHGPLPFGAEFLAQKSDKNCFLNSKTVECTLDLGPGASKDLSLMYKAGGSMSCSFARLLEKAKVTLNSLTGSTNANSVVTSVTCRMESSDIASANGVEMGSNSNSDVQNVISGSGKLLGSSGFKGDGFKQGYKQYQTVMPRTGAMHDYFASVETPKNMIIQHQNTSLTFSVIPILLLSVISIFTVFALFKTIIRH